MAPADRASRAAAVPVAGMVERLDEVRRLQEAVDRGTVGPGAA